MKERGLEGARGFATKTTLFRTRLYLILLLCIFPITGPPNTTRVEEVQFNKVNYYYLHLKGVLSIRFATLSLSKPQGRFSFTLSRVKQIMIAGSVWESWAQSLRGPNGPTVFSIIEANVRFTTGARLLGLLGPIKGTP